MSFRVWIFALLWFVGGSMIETRAAELDGVRTGSGTATRAAMRDSGAATDSSCRLEHRFRLDSRVQSATLRLAADFCRATVEVNGRPLVSAEPYSPTVDADATADAANLARIASSFLRSRPAARQPWRLA